MSVVRLVYYAWPCCPSCGYKLGWNSAEVTADATVELTFYCYRSECRDADVTVVGIMPSEP